MAEISLAVNDVFAALRGSRTGTVFGALAPDDVLKSQAPRTGNCATDYATRRSHGCRGRSLSAVVLQLLCVDLRLIW